MSGDFIDFNRPVMSGKELEYISQAFAQAHISGDGLFTRKASALLQQLTGSDKVILTTSCTHALEMSALLLDLQPGDEVILPSFTFVSTANAFVLRGAKPVFIDVRADTLNLDETLLPGLITSRTRAIVPVHYAGVACEMDSIMSTANAGGIPVIEDNAHGLFGSYKGKNLGTFGCMATQSFHETKNITCGEGGALLINDPHLIERAEIIREKGTNRTKFYQGLVDKYTWVDVGSSYLPSEILAAVLYAQLENWEQIQNRRRQIWETYHTGLQAWARKNDIKMPFVPADCSQAYHMYYIILPEAEMRGRLMRKLREANILSVFHYQSLHLSEMGRRYGGKEGDCPVTEHASGCLLRLPFYISMTDAELERVIECVTTFEG